MINFKEIVETNTYDINQIDTTKLYNTFPFEKIDKTAISQSNSRQRLLDYKLINPDFLKKVDENGLPKFAIFSLNHEECYVELTYYFEEKSIAKKSNFNSTKLLNQYNDVFVKLLNQNLDSIQGIDNHNLNYITVKIGSTFGGIIPVEVRNIINNCKHKFDEVLIIAEAENWTVEDKVTYMPPNPDPLVVGMCDELMYYICSFDLTKLEDYIKREFTE